MKRALFLFVCCLHFGFLLAGDPPPASETPVAVPQKPADSAKTKAKQDGPNIEEQFQVLGSVENARKTPGSAHYLSKVELEKHQHTDIHRILRDVPGVYVQEEEGLGLRPNIGIRGTGVERSQKITLMEDGVLIAPAPYTAPAAYYFPTAGRMETVEVLKGPGTVSQGPYTNGGSLNMVSTSIPDEFSGQLNLSSGSHATNRLKAQVGGSEGRLGWLVETFQSDSDGFKKLDNGGDVGSRLHDYLGKLRFDVNGEGTQFVELKLGKTDSNDNETYLGLTAADFEVTPYRRYAASQNDYIETDHEQVQLRHFWMLSDTVSLTTTAYHNDFYRNWHKLEKTGGVANAAILANPTTYASQLAILRGETDSAANALTIRNNNRNYLAEGVQTRLDWTLGRHDVELGIRVHEDDEDRLQHEEGYRMTSGRMVLDSIGAPGSQENRLSRAEAFSAYVMDTISLNNWTFRPGVRFEDISYERFDYARTDPSRAADATRLLKNEVSEVLPGIGVDYLIQGNHRIFAGLYRGFSPPGAGQNEDTKSEKSNNYEFGYRSHGSNRSFELIGFFNDYTNLLGRETVSGGTGETGQIYNGGAVEVQGLELTFKQELVSGQSFSLPLSGSYTFTQAEFQTSFTTSFEDWGPQVNVGDELPYIPEHQVHLNLGYRKEQFGLNLGLDYSDAMRTKAGQGAMPSAEVIGSRWLFDLSGDYALTQRYAAYLQIRNLLDETYLTARRPAGLRPGLDRSFIVGAKARF